jgi:hypothetical protein
MLWPHNENPWAALCIRGCLPHIRARPPNRIAQLLHSDSRIHAYDKFPYSYRPIEFVLDRILLSE